MDFSEQGIYDIYEWDNGEKIKVETYEGTLDDYIAHLYDIGVEEIETTADEDTTADIAIYPNGEEYYEYHIKKIGAQWSSEQERGKYLNTLKTQLDKVINIVKTYTMESADLWRSLAEDVGVKPSRDIDTALENAAGWLGTIIPDYFDPIKDKLENIPDNVVPIKDEDDETEDKVATKKQREIKATYDEYNPSDEFDLVTEINPAWSKYDKETAEMLLENFGVIVVSKKYGDPIDNENDIEMLLDLGFINFKGEE